MFARGISIILWVLPGLGRSCCRFPEFYEVSGGAPRCVKHVVCGSWVEGWESVHPELREKVSG